MNPMPRRLALMCVALAGVASADPISALLQSDPSRSALAAPLASASPMRATSAEAFLNSIGVNTHVDQGYDPESYVEPLRYTGIRQVRDGERHVEGDLMIHRKTGVRFAINGAGDLHGLLAAARILAAADALLALEGPNEANNFPITYGGRRGGGHGGTWVPVAQFQRDLYAAVKADPLLHRYPVFSPSETGAETDNAGLQFLVVPSGSNALFPAGTRFADFANAHNYVSGNGNSYGDNQAWNAADPVLNARWDGLYGNNGVTWHRHYQGYTRQALPALPRVTTETGWDTGTDAGGAHTQGVVLINTYLAQFKRGWSYTFVYEMRDGEGGTGEQGLYHGATPKLAATYLHNLTTLLSGSTPNGHAGSLTYAIPDQPATVHDLLLQKGAGRFDLIVWGERAHGGDVVTIDLGIPRKVVKVYDITMGTAPVRSFTNVASLRLALTDHAMIVEIDKGFADK
ncbi:MAG: hypothetical protein ACREFY_08700 [Acetobacteraceae bacterium]